MNQEIFIRAASCISPQQTFGVSVLPAELNPQAINRLVALEPDYKVHLNIPAARRMSRLIKMGVCAALDCLKNSDIKNPDAIICGTGLGCMEDSEKFLASLIANNEQTLSPTSFIFSTHNTVAAQIALLLQCNNYNFTHTHRGLSFENSLLDAMMFLNDQPDANVLAGATDEITTTSFTILERLGGISHEVKAGSVFNNKTKGFRAGEGSAFFMLNSKPHENNLAKLVAADTFSNPENNGEVLERVRKFSAEHQITSDDFILAGINGDASGDEIYHVILNDIFRNNATGMYKHLCGEYHTASAFACWLSAFMLKERKVPEIILDANSHGIAPKRILILNHYKGREYSMMLLEKC